MTSILLSNITTVTIIEEVPYHNPVSIQPHMNGHDGHCFVHTTWRGMLLGPAWKPRAVASVRSIQRGVMKWWSGLKPVQNTPIEPSHTKVWHAAYPLRMQLATLSDRFDQRGLWRFAVNLPAGGRTEC